MAAPGAADRARGGGPLLLLPLIVLLGLAGALLLTPAPARGGIQLLPEVTIPSPPGWLWIALVIAFLAALFGIPIARRIAGASSVPASLVGAMLILVGVGVLFDLLFRLLAAPSSPAATANTSANHTLTPPTNSSCAKPSGCLLPSGPSSPAVAPWYDGAALYALLIVAAVLVVLLYPRLPELFRPRSPGPPADAGATAERSLTEALGRLGPEGAGDDARRRIIRAYGQLLSEVARDLDGVGPGTPRELSRQMVERFGLSAGTAWEITALFEEARYSSGPPMAADAVPRAEAALVRALDEVRARRRPR